jgi:hypothetical protein
MGRSFADLQALYDRMIWIDSKAKQRASCANLTRNWGSDES